MIKKHLLASKCAYSSFHHFGVWIVYSLNFSWASLPRSLTFKTAELIVFFQKLLHKLPQHFEYWQKEVHELYLQGYKFSLNWKERLSKSLQQSWLFDTSRNNSWTAALIGIEKVQTFPCCSSIPFATSRAGGHLLPWAQAKPPLVFTAESMLNCFIIGNSTPTIYAFYKLQRCHLKNDIWIGNLWQKETKQYLNYKS